MLLLDKEAVLAAINSLPEVSPALGDEAVVLLQQQVSDLQAKLDAASKAMADEVSAVSAEQAKEADLQVSLDVANKKIADVKAALGL